MKMNYLLSTLAITSILATSTVVVAQSVNAQTSTEAQVETKANSEIPEVKKGYLIHYNVLRVELSKPVDTVEALVMLTNGDNYAVGSAVEKEGKLVAFDINLDDFAKKYPTQKAKEQVVNTLEIRYMTYDGKQFLQEGVTDEYTKTTLLNAVDQGELLNERSADTVTNIKKIGRYNQVIEQDAIGSRLLEGKITTLSSFLHFKVKNKFKADYTFQLVDHYGNAVGKAIVQENGQNRYNNLFVTPYNGYTSDVEYTLTMKSKQTGQVEKIASFTPFNLF